MTPLRLCFICAEYPPGPHGGIGTRYRNLGRALVRAGHEVRVTGAYPKGYPAPDYEEDEGVRVWRLRERGGKFGWVPAWWQQYRQIRRWIKKGVVDLVEAPDSRGWFAGWPPQPVPLVLRSSGSNTYFAKELAQPVNRLTHWMEHYSYHRADAWIAQTRHSGEQTRRLFPIGPPDAILPNIIDAPEAVPPFETRHPHRAVFTGTLTEKKGIAQLFKAWPRVAARVPPARLDVYGKDTRRAGGGSMRAHLEALLPEDVRPSVRFHGHVERAVLFDALKNARAGVFPSYTETFGNVAAEAMACGCPTVYTRRSVGPEVVRDETDGLLVDPDDPPEIAGALVRLLTDEDAARRFSRAGRRRVLTTFTAEAVLPKTLGFYRRLVRHTNLL